MHLIFDLDGVLVEFREIHINAFIQAWNSLHSYKVTLDFHAAHLEARPTKQKIAICMNYFGIHVDPAATFDRKQKITEDLLARASVYQKTKDALQWAISAGHTISCCSNSIRSTVVSSLLKLVPSIDVFKVILSNEDVTQPKPNPEIYIEVLKRLNIAPQEALVFEDSIVGISAAEAAGCRVISIIDALDITQKFLEHVVAHGVRPVAPKFNVVIPMAGMGSRFQKGGYSTPKPFLPVFGIPMFKWVINNIVPAHLLEHAIVHIIIREEHMDEFVKLKGDERIKIHLVPGLTEGAACTVLSIKELINNDMPLVVANSDQYLEWDPHTFYMALFHPEWDGVISTFEQHDPTDLRWSYAQMDGEGCVKAVAEKKFIGPLATTGIYGWSKGRDYVTDTEAMIAANTRVNNEFYVCPVYNTGIERGARIRTHNCKKMWGLGVPADYERFLANFRPIFKL